MQDDLRRVNALLVAHAEELRRGTTHIHELEGSVATASTLRVATESEMARAQASGLQATSRSALYRAGWLRMRQASKRRREAVDAHVRRLSVRVANSVLQLAVALFRCGLADTDLLLDPMMLHFPPAHSRIGRWYTNLQHTTLWWSGSHENR
ncbi:hypothetical protein PR003_g30545 [Phytophthora rubi]|uniref:Uncharacterized protein n=1 Tax=Phytophthora rubi TaxID=129364 RepID=A0A6A4BGK3_9STRA|nr:hypothetical protein PR003_g30545 [Phytophthora rubi]